LKAPDLKTGVDLPHDSPKQPKPKPEAARKVEIVPLFRLPITLCKKQMPPVTPQELCHEMISAAPKGGLASQPWRKLRAAPKALHHDVSPLRPNKKAAPARDGFSIV